MHQPLWAVCDLVPKLRTLRLSCTFSSLHACMLSCFSHVQLFATLWTVAHKAPLSMGFPSQEYWSGLPCPPPGDLPDQGLNSYLLRLLDWHVNSLPVAPHSCDYLLVRLKVSWGWRVCKWESMDKHQVLRIPWNDRFFFFFGVYAMCPSSFHQIFKGVLELKEKLGNTGAGSA